MTRPASTYRVSVAGGLRVLGLRPADGPLGNDGISAALGPAPTDPGEALRRELAIKALPVEFQPQRTIERAVEGPALSLD